jgi:hypothetical protein
MKRIIRKHGLTREEIEKYREIRQKINDELPELIARHHERIDVGGIINESPQHRSPSVMDDDDFNGRDGTTPSV